MSATTRWYGVTLDCPDPQELASFYKELTGMEISYSSEEFAGLSGEHGVAIGFQKVNEFRAPEWPGQAVPQQFHLDIAVDSLDDAEEKAVKLGATKAETQPGGERWRVMLDPAGHPFCLAAMG
jgi:hypothetical protein